MRLFLPTGYPRLTNPQEIQLPFYSPFSYITLIVLRVFC